MGEKELPYQVQEPFSFGFSYLAFDQLAHNLVVKEFDGSPLNALVYVFLLFCLER